MTCEGCKLKTSIDLASAIVDENPDAMFEASVRGSKLAEIGVLRQLLEKASTECSGVKDDGTCGVAMQVSDAKNIIFNQPATPLSVHSNDRVGFTKNGDVA